MSDEAQAQDVTKQDAAEEVAFREDMASIYCPKFSRGRKKNKVGGHALLLKTLSQYITMREMAERFLPNTVLEVGARCGHVGYALNRGNPGLLYLGVDAWRTKSATEAAFLAHAKSMLSEQEVKHVLLHFNLDRVKEIAGGGCDLVVLTGYTGKRAAHLELAKNIAPIIIADWYHKYPDPVDAFCTANSVTPEIINSADYDPGGSCDEVSYAIIDLS